MSGLRLRVATATALALAMLAALGLRETAVGPWPWYLLVALLALATVWEWAGLLGLRAWGRRAYALAAALLAGGALAWAGPPLLLWLTAGFWVATLLCLAGVGCGGRLEAMLLAVLGLCAAAAAGQVLTALPTGQVLVLVATVAMADTAAYGIGHRYGRTPLAPELSPGKTRAGLVGALAGVALLSVPVLWAWGLAPAAWFYVACLMLLAACFSVVGDLTASRLKRRAGVKDSGTLLPGHGGALDRFDGLLGAAPVFALGLHGLQRIGVS